MTLLRRMVKLVGIEGYQLQTVFCWMNISCIVDTAVRLVIVLGNCPQRSYRQKDLLNVRDVVPIQIYNIARYSKQKSCEPCETLEEEDLVLTVLMGLFGGQYILHLRYYTARCSE